MSALLALPPGAGGAPDLKWSCLARYQFSVAVAVSDLLTSPEEKYQGLIDPIMRGTFTRLYGCMASPGQQSDKVDCVHWSWKASAGLTATERWLQDFGTHPCSQRDLAYEVKQVKHYMTCELISGKVNMRYRSHQGLWRGHLNRIEGCRGWMCLSRNTTYIDFSQRGLGHVGETLPSSLVIHQEARLLLIVGPRNDPIMMPESPCILRDEERSYLRVPAPWHVSAAEPDIDIDFAL